MKRGTTELSNVLYSKNIGGTIKYWRCTVTTDTQLYVEYGDLNGKPIFSYIVCKNSLNEAKKRYKEKYNKGYRTLNDLRCNSIADLTNNLPSIILDENQCFKAMLCQPFKLGKDKWPRYAQPKINGLRGTNSFKEVSIGEGMFKTTNIDSIFRSREGIEYVLPILSAAMLYCTRYDMKLRYDNYDGELYIPEAPLNVIKSAIPYKNEYGTISKSNEHTNNVQYWIFDLAIPIDSQSERLAKLNNLNKAIGTSIIKLSSNPHKAMEVAKSYSKFIGMVFIVTGMMIHSDEQAIWYRDQCIAAGFEGCVFRDMDAEYAFGQRPSTITKFKKFKATECKILDIIDESEGDQTGDGIKMVLKNDINDETFNCSIAASFAIRKNLIENKQVWIDKYATVEYGERSGVKKCPFHCHVVTWGREDIGDIDINNLKKE